VVGTEKINLTDVQQTMLITLYAKAVDSRAPRSILHDRVADEVTRQIDYDWRKTHVRNRTSAAGVALRAKHFDDWTREFLADRQDATVLHLACGLDGRVFRVDPSPEVRWIDVDYPDVIALRERLLPARGGDYRMIGASVTDENWLDDVPADRPVVAVLEGLTPYLHEDEVKRLIQRITGRFPHGQLLFDALSTLALRLERKIPGVRKYALTMHWGLDDPREPERWHPGLECLDVVRAMDQPGTEVMPAATRLAMRGSARVPGFRDFHRFLRYRF
jgi:O-methyltransferase involved in polyketide biosynthesis